jgi:hypothetical protein
MSILRDFEKRLEGVVEGFFARAFRSGLQPVELAKAVQRYAGNYQQVGLDGVIVPNVYRFVIAKEDLDRFGGYVTPLQRELAEVVQRTAADRDWRLKGPVRIEFEEGEQVRVGTYELRGKVEAPGTGSQPKAAPKSRPRTPAPRQHAPPAKPTADADADAGATRVISTASSTSAILRPLGGTGEPQRITARATVGRLPDCDVTLDDASVSRRHAELTETNGTWEISDLGSTNGVKLNGERVQTARLADGDRLELGNVKLTFALED